MNARCALVARCDRGGLAVQTWELARHLKPTRVLVVDMGPRGRGPANPSPYKAASWECEYRIAPGPPDMPDFDWLVRGADVVLTVETPYRPGLMDLARRRRVPVVVHANPELWRPTEYPSAIPVLPTTWEAHRIPNATVLPMPVARDRLPRRNITKVDTFLHLWAPAMRDRNGTDLVLAACEHVRSACRLVIRAPASLTFPHEIGKVTIVHNVTEHDDYAEAWPEGVHALVMPRRYGGLSLPMNEAASLGLPIISLDLEPQRRWLPHLMLAPVADPVPVAMKGGMFKVWTADPREIAARMSLLVGSPETAQTCAAVSDIYAESISWERRLPEWEAFLDGVVSDERAAAS